LTSAISSTASSPKQELAAVEQGLEKVTLDCGFG
jgi:hypothetical protein